MPTLRSLATIALTLLLWTGSSLAQGLYWETETTSADSKETSKGEVYAMPKMMKISQGEGHAVILRSDQDKMISLDEGRKTYWEASVGDLEKASKSMQTQMEAAMKQMEKQMKDMPPEQRAQVEKMIANMPGSKDAKKPKIEVKATSEKKKIGGYECTKYVAFEDGKEALVAWTTPDVKDFNAIRDDWMAFQKRLTETSKAFGSSATEAYTQIPGFPMETEMQGVKTVVTKVEPRKLAASDFQVPAGYTKETPEFLKQN